MTLHDFSSVPPGTYRCRIAEVRTGTTRAGDERWSVSLVVAEGPHAGRQAAWDSLVFSVRGCIRARMILQALGIGPRGWYSVVLLGVSVDLDDPFQLIPHCTGATWGLRRRCDAVEAAQQHLIPMEK